jgi:hypothetical protein
MKAMGNYDFECIPIFLVQVKLFFVMMEFVNDNFMCWGVKCMGLLGHWWKNPTNTLSLLYFGHLKKKKSPTS